MSTHRISAVERDRACRLIENMEAAGWRVSSLRESGDTTTIEFRPAREWGGWITAGVMLALCVLIVWSGIAILGGGA